MEHIDENIQLIKSFMTLLENHFGENCEVVLHDFTKDSNHSIVDIRNGHVTKRTVGGCATNLGLEILGGSGIPENKFNDINYSNDGRILRSSSIYFQNSKNQTIGSLCVNLDITDSLYFEKYLRKYNNFQSDIEQQQSSKEIFTSNVHELLDQLIEQCIDKYGKSPKLLSKEEKMQFIADLDAKGAFIISKSSNRVCSMLGISRYTFYNYLDTVRKSRENSNDTHNKD